MAYCTRAEVRAMEGMSDVVNFTDADIETAIEFADMLIDEYTGTSWEVKSFSLTLNGSGRSRLTLADPFDGRRILFPRSITSCTIDGVAQTDMATYALFPEGYVIRDEDAFTYNHPGMNVTIAGTAGCTTSAPVDIAWCSRTIARQYVIDLVSRVEDRAVMMQTELGMIRLSQPGAKYPTGLPQVDAILNRRRHIGPAVA
jgi:hypothetical protein